MPLLVRLELVKLATKYITIQVALKMYLIWSHVHVLYGPCLLQPSYMKYM